MRFEKAIRESVKAFSEGMLPEKTLGLSKEGIKYTPEYFDNLEMELNGTYKKEKEDVDVNK